MRLVIIASGSSGNSALIEHDGRAVLLDAGISARETLRRLAATGLGSVTIEALLVTHEHSDHTSGVRVLARRLNVPVFGSAGTLAAIEGRIADVPRAMTIRGGDSFETAGMRLTAFRTAHDAVEPLGFTFEASGRRVGVATDTGVVTAEVAEALSGCHVIGIEANHDLIMLRDGHYPPFLKARIAGDRGHLSNDAAATALEHWRWSGLSHVFALHLSEHNNTPETARRALAATIGGNGTCLETVSRYGVAGCTV